ncbi:MAG: cation diffusion facilitator family transporter [Magnetospirillum sp. WYHS-4]
MRFEHCQKCAVQAGWADLAGTLGQAVFRSLLGWLSGSMGLAVQGLYSVGDALTKGITLASVRFAKVPPTKTFPFGTGKILFVSSLAIGVGLLLGGAYLGLTSLVDREGMESVPSALTAAGIVLSAAFSGLMSRYLGCVSAENNNMAIKAAAWDNRIDAISSIVVLVGVALSNLGVPAADHGAAFIVSLMVLRIGGSIAWDATKGLLDVTVPRDVLAKISRTARMTKGVQDVKLIRGRSLGESWEIYLHVAIDGTLTISDVQDIVDRLKSRIQEEFSQVQHIWVITVPHKARDQGEADYWADHLFSMPRNSQPQNTPAAE